MIKRGISGVLLAVACCVVWATVALAVSGKTAVGTWKLDLKKSSYQNMPAPKFEQLVILTDDQNSTKWSLKGIGADGKSYISSYDGPIDGKDHPMMSSESGSAVAYTRVASGGLQWTVKDKSGAVIETGSGELSPDGNTLTLKGTTRGPSGRSEFTSVFLRSQ